MLTRLATGVFRLLDPAFWPGRDQLLEVATPQGLLSAEQMNRAEFHIWNAVKTAIGKPDPHDLRSGSGNRPPPPARGPRTKRDEPLAQTDGVTHIAKKRTVGPIEERKTIDAGWRSTGTPIWRLRQFAEARRQHADARDNVLRR